MTAFVDTTFVVLVVVCAVGWWRASLRVRDAAARARTRDHASDAVEHQIRLAERAARFGTWSWDEGSGVISLSGGAADISGLGENARQVAFEQLYGTVHPDDRAPATHARERALENGSPYVNEFRRTFSDG